jgi:hypothetical protein
MTAKPKSKATYTSQQFQVLLIKEAFVRDLNLFKTLLDKVPQSWTLTVIEQNGQKELVVNIPPKSK